MTQPMAGDRPLRGLANRGRSCSGEAADYLASIAGGNDDPVIRLAGQVKDRGGLAPMTDREGNTVKVRGEVPDGADRADGRPAGRHVRSVDLHKPVRDGPGADHSGPRHREISMECFYLLRYRQGHGHRLVVHQHTRHTAHCPAWPGARMPYPGG